MAVPETTDYDTIAEDYSAKIDERPWNALYERPTTLALLPTVNNTDVLDAGCGHGWYADWLVRHGARVVAVDRSAAMVALAQKRLADRRYNKVLALRAFPGHGAGPIGCRFLARQLTRFAVPLGASTP